MSQALINRSKNLVIAQSVEDAKTMVTRMRGLLGREGLSTDTALWLEPGNSIHTFFMKFTIDAIFVDRDLKVRKVVRHLKPWRLILPVWGASSVFELAAGQAVHVSEGDQLHVGH